MEPSAPSVPQYAPTSPCPDLKIPRRYVVSEEYSSRPNLQLDWILSTDPTTVQRIQVARSVPVKRVPASDWIFDTRIAAEHSEQQRQSQAPLTARVRPKMDMEWVLSTRATQPHPGCAMQPLPESQRVAASEWIIGTVPDSHGPTEAQDSMQSQEETKRLQSFVQEENQMRTSNMRSDQALATPNIPETQHPPPSVDMVPIAELTHELVNLGPGPRMVPDALKMDPEQMELARPPDRELSFVGPNAPSEPEQLQTDSGPKVPLAVNVTNPETEEMHTVRKREAPAEVMSGAPPAAMFEAPPAAMPEVPPAIMSEAPPAVLPEELPVVMPEAPPAVIFEAPPAAMPGVPPAVMPEAAPAVLSEAPSAVMPEAPPAAMPEVPPAVLPEAPPVVMPGPPSAAMFEAPPATMPEVPPAVMSEAPPAVLPEAPSTVMPEAPPAVLPEALPVVMPEAPPAVMFEAPPAAMPGVPPAVMPEAPPAVLSEAPPAAMFEALPAATPEVPPVVMPEAAPAVLSELHLLPCSKHRLQLRLKYRLLSCLKQHLQSCLMLHLLQCLKHRLQLRLKYRLWSCLKQHLQSCLKLHLLPCLKHRLQLRLKYRL
ncbi:hypothetical protein ANCCAN_04762 [Ancylostoma caninum]|uniref:Uncharacterized protein n=1 Tax=Ancylostoma caninum TaxID=29170 RepID=A0A368H0Q7_ANCCA|nr:hypothetical protein ANCCAN_04762 [Ancylostoma caninum]